MRNLDVPLELHPLSDVGTRVIVPYLLDETVEAFQSGPEIYRWCQRTWWRAVQLGLLEITIGSENEEPEVVSVPTFSADEPWNHLEANPNVMVAEIFPLEDGSPLKIKRIVLTFDEDLQQDEILGDPVYPEFAGIQAFRGYKGWRPFGSSTRFHAYIPPNRRPDSVAS